MTEDAPAGPLTTRADIAAGLTALGVRPGATLLVHSSVKALGWVPGGALSVVQGLLDAVGPEGTLVVPTQTGDNSDPAGWARPPVPAQWWPLIREHSPGFDPVRTPSRHMGAVPEQVRTWPGARRSAHPQTSFAALGPRADEVVAVHDLDCQLGERSPLAALERLGAEILLLGAGFGSCTALHLAEYRVPGAAPTVEHGAAVLDADGGRLWVTFRDLDLDEGDFGRIGEEMGRAEVVPIRVGPVGAATARLLPLAPAVAWAAAWMSANRPAAAP